MAMSLLLLEAIAQKTMCTLKLTFPATEMVLQLEQGWDSELQDEKSTSQFQP